jgi:predicted MFS family arabinose efflux permease
MMSHNASSTGAVRPARSRTFSALDHPGFRRYYLGQGISLVGTWLQTAAVRWLVFERTNSEFMLGIVELASLLPGILVGLFAGAAADRAAPLGILVVMECGQMALALLMAALVGLDVVQIWQMALILALARICVTFELPSRQVFFYELVGPECLPNAIALNSGLFNVARIVGPALSGVCLSAFGAFGCFALNGLSYLAAIATIASIRLPERQRRAHVQRFQCKEVLDGLNYLWAERRVLAYFALVAFFGLTGMGFDAMIAVYARRVVLTGVVGYSILLAASGIGATAGTVVVASLSMVRRPERIAITGLLLFAFFLAGAAMLPSLAGARSPNALRLATAGCCAMGVGFGVVIFYSSSMMAIQLAVPDGLRGRITGIWTVVFSASVPLGSLWMGRAAEAWGIALVMEISSALCLLIGVLAWSSGAPIPLKTCHAVGNSL